MWFAPRRPGSMWTRINKGRVARLEEAGLMEPAGAAAVAAAKESGMWTLMDPVEDLVVPDDLAAAFDVHPGAREHWESFSPSSRKQMLAWIVMAKKPETRAVRVLTTAAKAALGEQVAVRAGVRRRSRPGRTPAAAPVDHLDDRVRLGPGALQHLGERLGRLRAGDAVLLVDDEERHAGGAVGLRLLHVGVHLGGVLGAGQHLVDPGRVEARGHADLTEHGVVGDVAGVGEVGLQQRLLDPALQARCRPARGRGGSAGGRRRC